MLDFSSLPDVSGLHPELTEPGELEYAAHMKVREDALHSIFGTPHPQGDILSPADPNLSINWPGGGVYQYPAGGRQDAWHYVTSGLSHPFPEADQSNVPDEQRYSGLGCELVISAPNECAWAPDVLLNLVRYLLFDDNARAIFPGDRIPCNGPLVLETDTKLNHLVALFSPEYETQVALPAGRCEIVHMVGATEAEIDAAKGEGQGTLGSLILCSVMQELGVGTTSDPDRECLTAHPQFPAAWGRAKADLSDDST